MSMIDELTSYRVKVEKDGKEIVNVPGILALPGALIAPKLSIVGTVAASLLGCSIHLETGAGKKVDVGKEIKKAADTVMDTAKTAAKTVKEEIDRVWNDLSADDPEECPVGEENQDADDPEESPADEEDQDAEDPVADTRTAEEIAEDLKKHEADDVPVIHVDNPHMPE